MLGEALGGRPLAGPLDSRSAAQRRQWGGEWRSILRQYTVACGTIAVGRQATAQWSTGMAWHATREYSGSRPSVGWSAAGRRGPVHTCSRVSWMMPSSSTRFWSKCSSATPYLFVPAAQCSHDVEHCALSRCYRIVLTASATRQVSRPMLYESAAVLTADEVLCRSQ